jgi:hypothetical protein
MKRVFRQSCLVLVLAGALQAQAKLTSDQLVQMVKSNVQLKRDDVTIAAYIKKIKLSDKLDARTVETLQGLGAGPRTVAALKGLMTESASLAEAPPPPPKPIYVPPPPPDSIAQAQILQEITEKAINYSRNLPNFLCLQVTRRYADQGSQGSFRLLDTIAERLTYFEQKENYQVISKDGIPTTGMKHDQLGGASSSGEFGSMLLEIFEPSSRTSFEWERWATLRGHRMHVYSFRVPQETSKYNIIAESVKREIVVGYHGLIYADRDTKQVMRITMSADDIPPDFPVQEVDLDLNYDMIKIADQEFLLPLKSELHSKDGRYLTKNETEFRNYNKYGTESSITFDVPDALPADQTQEQPVQPAAPPPAK